MDQATGRLSPLLKQQRIKAAVPHLKGSVLDFGCGDGALANHVPPDRYLGFDIERAYLAEGRRLHPEHSFSDQPQGAFDTVAALAVIEHLEDPSVLFDVVESVGASRLVLTTPKPTLEWAHHLGSKIGLFSGDAHDEHVTHLDRASLRDLAEDHSMRLDTYRTFLFGANQLAVLTTAVLQ